MDKPVTAPAVGSLWRNQDYLWLWGGQAVSSLGTGVSQFAFPLLILVLTRSPAAAGFATALGKAPHMLFSLPAGALVDRWNRKRIMLICTLGLLLCTASIPVALIAGRLTLLQVYLVSFLLGSFTAVFRLAAFAAITRLVPQAQRSAAAAQDEAVYSTVSLMAPSLGGLLFGLRQMLPFIADAASYLVLLGALLKIRRPLQDAPDKSELHLLREIREGFRWLWSLRLLRLLALLAAYLELLLTGSILIVLVIAQHQGVSDATLGVIFAIGGVGNLLGTTLSAPLQRRAHFGRTLSVLLVLFLVVWPFYGLAPAPWFLAAVVAGWSMIDSLSAIQINSYRLTAVPDALQGRVGSLYRVFVYGTITLGQALIGLSLQYWGVLPTVGALWAGLALVAISVLLQPEARQATFPETE